MSWCGLFCVFCLFVVFFCAVLCLCVCVCVFACVLCFVCFVFCVFWVLQTVICLRLMLPSSFQSLPSMRSALAFLHGLSLVWPAQHAATMCVSSGTHRGKQATFTLRSMPSVRAMNEVHLRKFPPLPFGAHGGMLQPRLAGLVTSDSPVAAPGSFQPRKNKSHILGLSASNHLPTSFSTSESLAQNPVVKWSTQNHVKNSDGGGNYFWLGLPLTNLHLPGL